MEPPYPELAGLMRTLKEERGLSQSEIARRIGVAPSQVSGWASGRSRPQPENLEKLAEGYGLDLDYLQRICKYRSVAADYEEAVMVQSELEARLAKLGATLSKYPRAVWLAVLEANERMADALHHAEAEPPVSAPSEGGVSASGQPLTQGPHDPEPPLSLRKRALAQVGAW